MDRYELFKKSSMCNWFPRLKKLDVRYPETWKVDLEINEEDMNCPAEWDTGEVKKTIEKLGLPVFIRTDQSSHKHWMEKASKISEMNDKHIDSHIFELINHNALVLFIGRLPFSCLYLREWIDIEHGFKAFLGNMKVGKEVRCFINDNELLNKHYYWIEDAIRDPNANDWREKLKEIKNKSLKESESEDFMSQLRKVCDEFDGFWSVDFAKTKDGWHIIDMARGEVSWYPKMDRNKGITHIQEYKELYNKKS